MSKPQTSILISTKLPSWVSTFDIEWFLPKSNASGIYPSHLLSPHNTVLSNVSQGDEWPLVSLSLIVIAARPCFSELAPPIIRNSSSVIWYLSLRPVLAKISRSSPSWNVKTKASPFPLYFLIFLILSDKYAPNTCPRLSVISKRYASYLSTFSKNVWCE